MKSLAVRVALLGLYVIAAGGAAYLFWMDESRGRAESRAARDFDQSAFEAERNTLEIRSAQEAYVATGQGDQFWTEKVGDTAARLREVFAELRALATPAAQPAIDEAAASLQDFEQMDRRAREYTRNGQKLLASDLIFGDGLDKTAAILISLEQARTAERETRDRSLASAHRRQFVTIGGAVGGAVLLMLLLVPVERTREEVVTAPSQPAVPVISSSDLDLKAALDREWSPAVIQPPAQPGPPAVEISDLAALCSELSRVADFRSLPALLERAAAVLDASGIIVWISDPDGRELSPIMTHGYSPQLLTRLGTIPRDGENATAAAFRTGLLQTVKADAVSNGAVAAPLVTPGGCVGVMAAEVRHEGEKDAAKLAIATIVAAQLAALVGPPSSRAHKVEAARG